jgi:hypothetical protein
MKFKLKPGHLSSADLRILHDESTTYEKKSVQENTI